MEVIEDCRGRAATIIASQLPMTEWFGIICENTVAYAALDRLEPTLHRIIFQRHRRTIRSTIVTHRYRLNDDLKCTCQMKWALLLEFTRLPNNVLPNISSRNIKAIQRPRLVSISLK